MLSRSSYLYIFKDLCTYWVSLKVQMHLPTFKIRFQSIVSRWSFVPTWVSTFYRCRDLQVKMWPLQFDKKEKVWLFFLWEKNCIYFTRTIQIDLPLTGPPVWQAYVSKVRGALCKPPILQFLREPQRPSPSVLSVASEAVTLSKRP